MARWRRYAWYASRPPGRRAHSAMKSLQPELSWNRMLLARRNATYLVCAALYSAVSSGVSPRRSRTVR